MFANLIEFIINHYVLSGMFVVLLVLLGILRPTRGVLRAAEPAATPLLARATLRCA